MFGPYILEVGCTRTSLNFTDSISSPSLTKYIGSSIELFTFTDPKLSLSWCKVIKNVAVSTDPEKRTEKVKTC